MRIAGPEDLTPIVDLLVRAYQDNPTLLRIVGTHKGSTRRMRILFRVSVADAMKINSVHITDNGHGIAVIYPIADKPGSLWSQLKLVFSVSGLSRGIKALKREKLIKQIRPKGDYLHFWILAVDPLVKGIETVQEMRDFAFNLSARTKQTIYAETPMKRTKMLYERYGFTTYDQWEDGDYTVWFLKRPPFDDTSDTE